MTTDVNYDGRRPLATEAHIEEVVRLLADGKSLREIAERVFGSPRYKDRVARIRDRRPTLAAGDDEANAALRAKLADVLAGDDPSLEAITRAYKLRLVARLREPGARVLPSEFLALLRLERHVETDAQIAALNALVREGE